METPQTRGSAILASVTYVDALCDGASRPHASPGFSQELKEALRDMKRTTWHPRGLWLEVLNAVVAVQSDTEKSYADLVGCGNAICEDAVNTFMKLILKIMTPRLFARKFPDFWTRDMRGGYMVVDGSEIDRNKVSITLKEADGWDHVGPVGCGFMGFAMQRITGGPVRVVTDDWSLSRPARPEVTWVISW